MFTIESRFFFGLTFFLFLGLKTYCQKIEYAAQPIDNYNYDYLRVIGYNDDGFFLLQSNLPIDEERDRLGFKSRKYKVSYFSSDLHEKWTRLFEKDLNGSRIESIGVANGNLIAAKSIYVENENKILVEMSPFDISGKEIEKKTIAEIPCQPGSNLDKIKFVASIHQTCFGFIQVEKKQNKTQTLHCIVLDTALKVLHTLHFDISYDDKNFYFTDWLLTDSGDFVLLGYHDSKQNSIDKKRWEAYRLFVAKPNKTAKEYAVNTPNLIFSGIKPVYDSSNDKLVLAGFYENKLTGSSGIVYSKLGLGKDDSLHTNKQPIAEGYKAKLLSAKNYNYKSISLNDYNVEKIVLRNDGGAVIVAEASYASDYSYYDYFTQSYVRQTEFHFENAIALSVNADGSIDWDAILRKDQASINDDGAYSSFCIIQADEKINLFYNTSIERNNRVAVFSVTNSGQENEKDFIAAEEKILLIPSAAKQISADELVVPCWNRRKLLLAKITF